MEAQKLRQIQDSSYMICWDDWPVGNCSVIFFTNFIQVISYIIYPSEDFSTRPKIIEK